MFANHIFLNILNKLAKIFKPIVTFFSPIAQWDWRIIGICMFISSFIWVLNALNKSDYSTKIRFPILIQHSDSLVIEVIPPPKFITVYITGTGWSLLQKSLGFGMDAFVLDLIRPTEHKFVTSTMLLPELTDRLRDVKLNSILEDTIFFEFDSIATKNIILAIDPKTISLAENHFIDGAIMADPLVATVYGPSREMKSLKDTFWLKIPENDIKADYNDLVSLFPLPSNLMTISPTSASVRFSVNQYENRISRVNMNLINFPSDSSRFIRLAAPIYLEYKIPAKMSNEWKQADTLAVHLDLKTMSKKDSLINPIIYLPPFCRDIEIVPKAFKVSQRPKKNEKLRNNRRNRQR